MKRFFCTKCQKVKRVQHWPVNIENSLAASPLNRLGECNWHRGIDPRVPRRVRAQKPVRVFNAPVVVTKSRKRA